MSECGQVFVSGENTRGQLGIGMDIKKTDELIHVDSISWAKVIKIACGLWHALILNDCGDIYCWGWNKHGQLGLGDCSIVEFPTWIEFDFNDDDKSFIDIACGAKHSAALCSDGMVYLWGDNKFHQIDSSCCKIYQTPKVIEPLSEVKGILCGYNSTVLF